MTDSAEQYWEVMSDHVSSVVMALAGVDEPTRARIAAAAVAAVVPYERGGKTRVPGAARCIIGTKPLPV